MLFFNVIFFKLHLHSQYETDYHPLIQMFDVNLTQTQAAECIRAQKVTVLESGMHSDLHEISLLLYKHINNKGDLELESSKQKVIKSIL